MAHTRLAQLSRMQGLFRSEMEPSATGRSPWMACENHRRTSSGVSFFGIA